MVELELELRTEKWLLVELCVYSMVLGLQSALQERVRSQHDQWLILVERRHWSST